MIPVSTKIERAGNITFESEEAMTIDPAAMSMVIKTLINMYSNPHAAVLRELTSNAWDAHVQAGQGRPVEVTLPSALNPSLIIEDFGVGLDREGLRLFGQFGTSTKRESNKMIGAFGIGSKSPISIASSYTVDGTFDGMRSTIVIGKNEDDTPYVGLRDDLIPVDADTPNGIRITIPIRESYRLTDAAAEMFLGWPKGSILINGQPQSLSVYDSTKFDKFTDVGYRHTASGLPLSGHGESRGLVGPVVYPIRWRSISNLPQSLRNTETLFRNAVLNLEIGSVDLTPSREELMYTSRTNEKLIEQAEKYLAVAQTMAERAISDAGNFREAVQARLEAKAQGFDVDHVKFHGRPLVVQFTKKRQDADLVTEVQFSWRGDTLTSTKHAMLFKRTAQAYADNAIRGSYNYVLVTDAGPVEPVKTGQSWGGAIHALTKQRGVLSAYGKAISKKKSWQASSVRLLFVTDTAEDLESEFLESFTDVITAQEFLDEISAYRTAQAVERRKNYTPRPKASDTSEISVSVATWMKNGNTYWSRQTLADLAGYKVILLRAGDKWSDDLYQVMNGKRAYQNTSTLSAIADLIAKDTTTYKVVRIPANRVTKKWDTVLTEGIVRWEDVLQGIFDEAFNATDQGALSMSMRFGLNSLPYWTRELGGNTDDIRNEETRAWFATLHGARNADTSVLDQVIRASKALTDFPVDVSKYTDLEADATLITNLTEQYPLLAFVQSYGTPIQAVLEYINLIDSQAK